MFGKNNRLVVRIFGLLGASAEGPLAVIALIMIIALITNVVRQW